jgi:exonuclease VII large subunit
VQRQQVETARQQLATGLSRAFTVSRQGLLTRRQLLKAYDPNLALQRGYALVRRSDNGELVKRVGQAPTGTALQVSLADGTIESTVTAANRRKDG